MVKIDNGRYWYMSSGKLLTRGILRSLSLFKIIKTF